MKTILRQVPDVRRLRLSSIDSIEADADLLEAIAGEPRLMPHLHLSLQAGDDMILKRMKRRHLRDDSIRFCAEVRRLRPDIVFGADIIAGFPTETEAMFQNSLDIVEECGLTHLHVFPFSPRAGTPAARMPQLLAQRRQGACGAAQGRRRLRRIGGISRRWPGRGSRSWSSAAGSAVPRALHWPRSAPAVRARSSPRRFQAMTARG